MDVCFYFIFSDSSPAARQYVGSSVGDGNGTGSIVYTTASTQICEAFRTHRDVHQVYTYDNSQAHTYKLPRRQTPTRNDNAIIYPLLFTIMPAASNVAPNMHRNSELNDEPSACCNVNVPWSSDSMVFTCWGARSKWKFLFGE